jgi:hypothetical protein
MSVSSCAFTSNTAGPGNTGGSAGALYDNSTSFTLSGSTFTSNSATGGGGGGAVKIQSAGTPSVTNCTFSSNSATANNTLLGGAGGALLSTSPLSVSGCTFTGNSASTTDGNAYGGAIYSSTTLSLTNCTLGTNTASGTTGADNTGTAFGGGIYSTGPLTITGTTFNANTASGNGAGSVAQGGGIWTQAGATLTVKNSTFYGNQATATGDSTSGGTAKGGAIYSEQTAAPTVQCCTVDGNSASASGGTTAAPADAEGGGIYIASTAAMKVQSTIMAADTVSATGPSSTSSGPDVRGPFNSQGYNFVGKSNGSSGANNFNSSTKHDQVGTIALPIDPVLSPLRDNGGLTFTMLPSATSPVIDQGKLPTGFLTIDQRGQARTHDFAGVPNASGGDGSDVGAVERQTPVIIALGPGLISSQVGSTFGSSPQSQVTEGGHTLPGEPVTYTLPADGASGTFPGGATTATVTTDDNGNATAPPITANTIAGSYTATATVNNGDAPALTTLTNNPGAPANVASTAGDGQHAIVTKTFATALKATVTDAYGNVVPGVVVTFAAPTDTPSGTFSGGHASVNVTTNSNGVATAPAFTADTVAGLYYVSASASGGQIGTLYSLTNDAGSPASITLATGSPQSAVVFTTFTTGLQAMVTDALLPAKVPLAPVVGAVKVTVAPGTPLP